MFFWHYPHAFFYLLSWRICYCLLIALNISSLFGRYIYIVLILLASLIALVIMEIMPFFSLILLDLLYGLGHLKRKAFQGLWPACHGEVDLKNQIKPDYQFPYFLTLKLRYRYYFFEFMELLIIITIFNNSKEYIT